MKYRKEVDYIAEEMVKAFHLYAESAPVSITQKSAFDRVTEVDVQIEEYLSKAITDAFPGDRILGEEMSSSELIEGRTWTIDPIDGTCNMAQGIKIYGVQCALTENGDIVAAAVYLPWNQELFTAIKGEGCFLNRKRITVTKGLALNNAIVSFGDYPHKNSSRTADWQHLAIRRLYGKIAKLRMFGAACMDFACVAAGRTNGCVVITTNVWDIAPGVLLCREAGATVTDLCGRPFKLGADGVIAGTDEQISSFLTSAFKRDGRINPYRPEKEYEGVIFDLDGVLLDTERYHFMAWNEALSPHAASISAEEYVLLRSTGRRHIIDTVCRRNGIALNEEEMAAVMQEKEDRYMRYISGLGENDLLPGVRSYLAFLKSRFMKMGIASSSRVAREQLAMFDLLPYFDAVVDGTSGCRKKPHPDLFLEAARQMNLSPEDGLVFEDAPVGIEAAHSGGFDVIGIGNVQSDRMICGVEDFTGLCETGVRSQIRS